MSNSVYILKASKTQNEKAYPPDWPVSTKAALSPDDDPSQWLLVEDYAAYVAPLQSQYDAWAQANGVSQPVTPPADPPSAPDGAPSELAIWHQKLAEGWIDPTTGIKLKTTDGSVDPNDNAQGWFSKMIALVTLGLQAGAITTATPMEVWDYDGNTHTLTTQDVCGLLLRYGLYCQQLFVNYKP